MKKLISSLAVVSSAAILGTLSMTAFAAGNGNAIIYDDGANIIYSDTHTGDSFVSRKNNFKISYTVIPVNEPITPEYLGLDDSYTLTKSETDENVYEVEVKDEETLNKLYEAAKSLYDENGNGKISNACKQYDYTHGCFSTSDNTKAQLVINLKEENDTFDPSSYAGLEGITFNKATATQYRSTSDLSETPHYISLDAVKADENVESASLYCCSCLLLHYNTMKTYLVYTPEPDPDPEPPFDGKGDADGDGKLTVRDAAQIARSAAKGTLADLPEAADYNGDGKVNVRDAAAIARVLAAK